MCKFNFQIPLYKWNVTLLIGCSTEVNGTTIMQELTKRDIQDPILSETLDNYSDKYQTAGDHFYNFAKRDILILIGKIESGEQLFEILGHEIDHLVDRISHFHKLDGTEARAYIAGHVWSELYRTRALMYLSDQEELKKIKEEEKILDNTQSKDPVPESESVTESQPQNAE